MEFNFTSAQEGEERAQISKIKFLISFICYRENVFCHSFPALKKSVKISKAANEEKTANMEKLPNETRLQYFDRLDQNVQEAITGTMMEAKKLRKKRKE